ncbi:methyltransferase type 11 [Arthrobacter sp. ZBG10]|uniref:class I SAM-dependent methyltransferase n=1 Tax=Micrococcaceae TaxID=1268 RepID=UPI0006825CE9|nr:MULTISPECIES: class I SAM-dependent methyltransferase [Micrococcaceae]KNH17253.1 methyltransferase type 11 [Arthrobacter sp. ZBG10]
MASHLTDVQRAELYDLQNTWAPDDEFFLATANQLPTSRILDLGCGTGRLTLALAASGHTVVGLDPDAGSLAAARRKDKTSAVTWVNGTSSEVAADGGFDLVVMTAHVVQAIHDKEAWARTLSDAHSALAPGGRLVFDSRDPAARAWEHWTPGKTRTSFTLPGGSKGETWKDAGPNQDGKVTISEHVHLSGHTAAVHKSVLAFRTEQELRSDLGSAGFTVQRVFGGWHKEPVGAGRGELVVMARR